MVAGDVVNTASRLQSAAPTNAIIVGERRTARRSTRSTIATTPPVEAKGKAEPVPVWEAVEARARVGVELRAPATPLVGRAHERELLLGAFERVRSDPSTQLITIVGVPGIGKSRLVARAVRPARARGGDHALAPGPVAAVRRRRRVLGVRRDGQGAGGNPGNRLGGRRRARSCTTRSRCCCPDEDVAWVESRLRPLVGLEAAGGARDESFTAWRRFVEALAERRATVLVFEDLHSADEDLLDFVDELVDWIEDVPLLVVATARPELLDRRPGWGGGKRNAVTLSLAPLTDDDTARLIAELLDRSLLPAETQQSLLARAGGNPLYAEQFARMFVERGEALQRAPRDGSGDHRRAARLAVAGGEEPPLRRGRAGQDVLDRRAPGRRRGDAAARAAAEGVRAPRAPKLRRGRDGVRVHASARPRRRLRTDPSRGTRGQARARGAVDRVACRGPRRGSRGATRAPLRRRPRVATRGGRRYGRAGPSRSSSTGRRRRARRGAVRVRAGRRVRHQGARARKGGVSHRCPRAVLARLGRLQPRPGRRGDSRRGGGDCIPCARRRRGRRRE